MSSSERRWAIPHATARFIPSRRAWERVGPAIASLTERELDIEVKHRESLLGDVIKGKDVVSFRSLREACMDPHSVLECMVDPRTGKVMGFTLAFPYIRFNPRWIEPEGETTAYIYGTALRPKFQGHGLVEDLIDPLFRDMQAEGYTLAARDSVVKNGYAATVKKRFSGRGIILDSYTHKKYGEDRQQFFLIDINAYLRKIDRKR